MRNFSVLFGLLCLTVLGCTENVEDVELPEHEPQLVAEAYITPDKYMEIFVGKTNKITEKRTKKGVYRANIRVTSSRSLFNDFTAFTRGYYADTMSAPDAGRTYTLKVNKEGFKPVTAKTKIPQPVQPQSAELIPNGKATSGGQKQHLIKINFKDRIAQKNFYAVKLENNRDTTSSRSFIPLSSDDPAVTIKSEGKLLLKDDLFEGNGYTLSASVDRSYDATKLRKYGEVTLRTVSESYFEYRRKLTLQIQNQSDFGPFNNEAVQIYSNVDNGYGVFAGYSEASVKIN